MVGSFARTYQQTLFAVTHACRKLTILSVAIAPNGKYLVACDSFGFRHLFAVEMVNATS